MKSKFTKKEIEKLNKLGWMMEIIKKEKKSKKKK